MEAKEMATYKNVETGETISMKDCASIFHVMAYCNAKDNAETTKDWFGEPIQPDWVKVDEEDK
jgi:hypothetical protein